MNKNISLENIAVSFDGEKILNDINLDIKDKEFVTFLGPSGCGKPVLSGRRPVWLLLSPEPAEKLCCQYSYSFRKALLDK